MQNGFFGVVNGFYTVPNCVMIDCGAEIPNGKDNEIMSSYSGGRSYCLMKEDEYRGEMGKAVCKCHVIRLIGVGLVGGGVICRVMKLLGKEEICFYGVSVSECGIALALPRERLDDAVRILAAELEDCECT